MVCFTTGQEAVNQVVCFIMGQEAVNRVVCLPHKCRPKLNPRRPWKQVHNWNLSVPVWRWEWRQENTNWAANLG